MFDDVIYLAYTDRVTVSLVGSSSAGLVFGTEPNSNTEVRMWRKGQRPMAYCKYKLVYKDAVWIGKSKFEFNIFISFTATRSSIYEVVIENQLH